MSLVVVGANSYVGGHFVTYARARGATVHGLTSADCDFRLRESVVDLFRSLGGGEHTVVFFAVVNKSKDVSYQAFVENTQFVRNLLDGCRHADIASILYLSSVDVYGADPELPIDEETRISPDTWYGLAKYSCEWMLAESGEADCPVALLRIPGVYGHGKNDRSVIGRMVRRAVQTGEVPITGRGDVQRDYLYVEDASRLLWDLVPQQYSGVLNLVSGESRSVISIADLVRQTLKLDVPLVHEPEDEGRHFDLVFDNGRLRRLLPEFRFSDLATGIRSYEACVAATKGGQLDGS